MAEVSVPARLAREVREFGEAIIAATQQADVSESLIANSGFKLILRCDYPKDLTFASQLLQIEPRWLPKLPSAPESRGSPYVFTRRFSLRSPCSRSNLTISDEEVRAQWSRTQLPVPDATPAPVAQTTEREETLLRDVATTPISPITHRYNRLGWHMEVGNRAKDAIIKRGLARFDAVSTPRGQVKILSLTPDGIALLASRGVVLKQRRAGGAAHEYWKHELRTMLERHGWHVTEEFALGGGKTADLRADRRDRTLFIEVETGRSDIAANLAKYPDDVDLVVFFASADVADGYRELLLLDRPGTRCLTPDEVEHIAA